MRFERLFCNCFCEERYCDGEGIDEIYYECSICSKTCYYDKNITEMISEGVYCPIWFISKLYDRIYCSEYEFEAIQEILNYENKS
ncbi:MAG: hypothetical protein AMQ22_01767 [Candidatus Methanofastidiosum methylothiophilum]|uniref:Uncharacterized protein n=1 Tax=Candidatus Methanofastidiosum methylothiophilum TaxID=1705564 RepID=A0A150IWD6_9EURY|nr:MAG: hypothetical protein AMQ22_01767 [Candidatus Methanofastidiosum methylthiophilus]